MEVKYKTLINQIKMAVLLAADSEGWLKPCKGKQKFTFFFLNSQ